MRLIWGANINTINKPIVADHIIKPLTIDNWVCKAWGSFFFEEIAFTEDDEIPKLVNDSIKEREDVSSPKNPIPVGPNIIAIVLDRINWIKICIIWTPPKNVVDFKTSL